MGRMVLINFALFKELFGNVAVQNDTVIGTLKRKKGEDKLVTCKIYNERKKSAKSRFYYLYLHRFTIYLAIQLRPLARNARPASPKQRQNETNASKRRQNPPTMSPSSPPPASPSPPPTPSKAHRAVTPPSSATALTKAHENYTDLNNPLAFSGDSKKLMKQIHSFK